MTILTLIITIALWNWLGGFLATFITGAFVISSLRRAEANPEDLEVTTTYFRWVAGAHLFNHAFTVLGTLLLCIGSISNGAPSWVAWGVFISYFVFWRLGHIIDAAIHFVTANSLPAASHM